MRPVVTAPEKMYNLRVRFGLTQMQLGKLLGGYSHAAVSYWEDGKREIPPAVKLLLNVLEAKGVKWLESWKGNVDPDPR